MACDPPFTVAAGAFANPRSVSAQRNAGSAFDAAAPAVAAAPPALAAVAPAAAARAANSSRAAIHAPTFTGCVSSGVDRIAAPCKH
jgi:hypothetical protein